MKSVLVTGGSGSFGQALTERLLATGTERICIYSRGEHKQAEMAARFNDKRLRFFIGDVRDKERLALAMRGCDTVVHCAAIKRVDTAEYNPAEAIKTNVVGAMNLIDAAQHTPTVRKVLALSTDKASMPINLYGASKLCAEKLICHANAYSGSSGPVFSCVRYGNVAGSSGSVIPYWRKLAAEGRALPITDIRMTRYWMSLDDAVDLVLRSIERMRGGELFIPRIPSFRVTDLALAFGAEMTTVGLRPGEKLHESLIGPEEAHNAFDLGDDYCIAHTIADETNPRLPLNAKRVPDGFSYTSDNNDKWLTAEGLRVLLAEMELTERKAA